jgi:hypothetical protein
LSKRVSLDSCAKAVGALISIARGGTRPPKGEQLALLTEHALQAVDALVWLRDDPEARALMAAQAERARNGGASA